MKRNKLVYYPEGKSTYDNISKKKHQFFRETNGNHPNDPSFRHASKQNTSSTLSDTSPSPPRQEANIDDEERQKREIAKRREEDRKRREVNS